MREGINQYWLQCWSGLGSSILGWCNPEPGFLWPKILIFIAEKSHIFDKLQFIFHYKPSAKEKIQDFEKKQEISSRFSIFVSIFALLVRIQILLTTNQCGSMRFRIRIHNSGINDTVYRACLRWGFLWTIALEYRKAFYFVTIQENYSILRFQIPRIRLWQCVP